MTAMTSPRCYNLKTPIQQQQQQQQQLQHRVISVNSVINAVSITGSTIIILYYANRQHREKHAINVHNKKQQ